MSGNRSTSLLSAMMYLVLRLFQKGARFEASSCVHEIRKPFLYAHYIRMLVQQKMAKDNDVVRSGPKSNLCPNSQCSSDCNFFALLLLSLLSIGFFAATVDKINGEARAVGATEGCLLYSSSNKLNNSAACGFVTWGQAIVLVFALAFIAYLVIRILAGLKV